MSVLYHGPRLWRADWHFVLVDRPQPYQEKKMKKPMQTQTGKTKWRRSAPRMAPAIFRKVRASLKALMENAEKQGDQARYWALWKVDALLSAWLESYA